MSQYYLFNERANTHYDGEKKVRTIPLMAQRTSKNISDRTIFNPAGPKFSVEKIKPPNLLTPINEKEKNSGDIINQELIDEAPDF